MAPVILARYQVISINGDTVRLRPMPDEVTIKLTTKQAAQVSLKNAYTYPIQTHRMQFQDYWDDDHVKAEAPAGDE